VQSKGAAAFGCVVTLADVCGEEQEMKQKHLILNALLGALTLLFAANLANAGEGFSVGASVARASVEAEGLGQTIDGDADGARIFGSYMFTRRFGIEAGYSDFGRPDDNTIAPNVEVESNSYDLYAVGVQPVSEKLDLFGKIGFVSWNTEIEEDETSEVSSSSTDLALGFGAEYSVSERFAIRSEFAWVDSDNSGAVRMVSLGGVFRFK